METNKDLQRKLREVDHKSYPAYKGLRGSYIFPGYVLSIDHVQGDPFAAPSDVHITVAGRDAGFPGFTLETKTARRALADYLLRVFEQQVQKFSFRSHGSGKSGLIAVTRPGQERLTRSACQCSEKEIILRFSVGFPANGRTINSRELEKIFFEYLPKCVEASLYYRNLNSRKVEEMIHLAEDQAWIRAELEKRKLTAFVADGAILPRESGVSSRPMKGAVPFASPDSLRITMDLPHRGKITGMGVRQGITLIVGGGYHGKSTLLSAIQLGIYDHIAGDGREYVITDDTAVKLQAEEGRFVRDVDISAFIKDLPNGKDTSRFGTEDASGSTSQAAGIIESIEAGCKLLLLDEDTSAANFMVRDTFMQQVVSPDKEPITPFVSRAKDLYRTCGMSTILVAGSSGAFFHIADTVIWMDAYKPVDITGKVKDMCSQFPFTAESGSNFTVPSGIRIMTKDSNMATKRRNYRTGEVVDDGRNRLKVKVNGPDSFTIGSQIVDLRHIEQLVDREQTAALGMCLKYAVEHLIDGRSSLAEIAEVLANELETQGFLLTGERGPVTAGLALPRKMEIYSCLNRYRRT
ncbi:MAG: ABC-ATPase domain-containing protein [Lachnospiraceae bacterium]|nr:ABC-ATPase domain-containing protein [Lachnospiraceae bacterium]